MNFPFKDKVKSALERSGHAAHSLRSAHSTLSLERAFAIVVLLPLGLLLLATCQQKLPHKGDKERVFQDCLSKTSGLGAIPPATVAECLKAAEALTK